MLRTDEGLASETIGVASLNILYDKRRTEKGLVEPQHQRIESLAQTIGSLPLSRLSIVMLQEVHVTDEHHNGQHLAELLEFEPDEQHWFPHNRKGEHLGVLGRNIDEAYGFDIGDKRIAAAAIMGKIAFINLHHRSGRSNGHLRTEQMGRVMEEVDVLDARGITKIVLAGDTNDHPLHDSRLMLARAGFTSVYKMNGWRSYIPGPSILPTTFPTKNYREILLTPQQRRAVPFGIPLDILEVRGFEKREVVQTGVEMTKKSDHKTLYAELAPKNDILAGNGPIADINFGSR